MPERLTRKRIVRSGLVRARAAFHGTRFSSSGHRAKAASRQENQPADLPDRPPDIDAAVIVGGGKSRHRG
jgi:hypothetical protein